MKRHLNKVALASAILAFSAAALPAAEPLFSYGFSEDKATGQTEFDQTFAVFDANFDGTQWKYTSYIYGPRPYYYAVCYDYKASTYDDYMTTKTAVSLEQGKVYCISYDLWCDSSSSLGTVKAGYCLTPDPDKASFIDSGDTGSFINKYSGDAPAQVKKYFTVDQTGDYYFTFHVSGGNAAIDNILIKEGGSATTPAAVTDLAVVPDPDLGYKATVSFTLPSACITGGQLASVSKVEIYRNDVLVSTLADQTPGAKVTFKDVEGDNGRPEGDVVYKVIVYNGEEASEPVIAPSVYVGPRCPNAVTDLSVEPGDGNSYKLYWKAPVRYTDGTSIPSSAAIVYDIYRVVDGEPALITDDTSTFPSEYKNYNTYTTFTDTYSADKRQMVKYQVSAKAGDKVSEAVETTEFGVGPVSLPFADSFAGAVLSSDWSNQALVGTKVWEAQKSDSHPYAEPQDEDGGLVIYNSYSSSSGNSARLASPEILNAEGSNPTFEFWMNHGSSGKDKLYVEVQADGGEWKKIEGSETTVENATTGWMKYSYPIAGMVEGSSKYRVALTSLSAYGYDIVVDNIRIYDAPAYDLQISAGEVADAVMAGKEAGYSAVVTNNGKAVAAADYQVEVYVDNQLETTLESVDIPSGESRSFEYSREFTAAETGVHDILFKVVYAADLVADNNEASAACEVSASAKDGVKEINGYYSETQKAVILNWTSPTDSDGFVPTDSMEDFKGCHNAVEATADAEAVEADYHNWKVYDLDGIDSSMMGSNYSVSTSVWQIFDSSNSWAPTGSNGSRLMIVCSPKTNSGAAPTDKSNDLLVSPAGFVNAFDAASFTVTVSARSASGSNMAVAYSTEETDPAPESFVDTKEISVPGSTSFDSYSFEVPGNARYIAIRHCTPATEYGAALYIDKIEAKSNFEPALGFHVYENGKRVNDAMLTATEFVIPVEEAGDEPLSVRAREAENDTLTRTFNISTVYDEGETALSSDVDVNVPTGVAEIDSEYELKVCGMSVSALSPIDVYTVDGTCVAAGVKSFIAPAPGLYILKAGKASVKVILK